MILLDFSSVMIANLHAQIGIQNMREVEEDLLRHMILNTVRAIRVKFKGHELVVACDKKTWRKEVYPYYKANRAKAKEKSDLDWRKIFEIFTTIRNELKLFFPYRVIEVEMAEADDVIGTLVRQYGIEGPMSFGEDIIIVSPDKDFAQLHKYGNVKQWDPIKKKWITHSNPDTYLKEHIIRGDSGDGVPNVMSDGDTFVIPEKRQKTMTAKRFEELFRAIPPEFADNFVRNTQMIDLECTPRHIQEEVVKEYEAQGGKNRSQILNYFIQKRLRNLTESLSEF